MIIVFCVPIRNEFPLHGHPGMTVLSKLSSSFDYAKAYDWISFDSTNGQTIETGEDLWFEDVSSLSLPSKKRIGFQ